jgi:sugar lactone lactonase YvrE
MNDPVTLVVEAQARLGEGALWDGRQQRLLWIDIHGQALHLFDPATGADQSFDVGQMIGTVVPRRSGGAVVALQHGLHAIDFGTGNLTFLCDPEADKPDNRFNDGKCDPTGRFWAGTMSLKGRQHQGALWRFDADLSAHRMLAPVSISNGIAWSGDARTMYYIDTPTGHVDAFDFDAVTGNIANRRSVITLAPNTGHPDGSTLDAEGMLWIAHWDGWRVTRWDPQTGECLQTIPLPVARVTSCAFGGPDLEELYITTARVGLTAAELLTQPQAGGLFCVRPGVRGLPAVEFAG